MTAATENAANHDALAEAFSLWKKTVEAELKGVPFEKKLVTRTFEGIALQPLYTRADRAGLPGLETAPGEVPFIRGTRSQGYKNSAWEFAQEIAAATPVAFNAAILADLNAGQNAVVLTPDAAARAGLDPDEAPLEAIGANGVSLADERDLATALAAVDLTAVPVHLRAGADALPLAALFFQLIRARKQAWSALSGSLTADPLGTWAETGTLPVSLDQLYDSLAGWTNWAAANAPQLRSIGVNVALYGDAGATATQELAFALASAADYLRALAARGVDASTALTRLRFRFAIGPQFFTEVAKFRAFRPLLARVASGFGVPPALVAEPAVHAATTQWDKTLLDPHVNMLRVTTEALSAVLGGVDSLHVAPFDEVRGETNEFSRRIARNVHTLLAEEFSFTQTADPAGGSWYVEKLTDELARKAWSLFQDIEGRGGFAASLKSGYVQELVAKSAAEKNDAIARRRLGLVGTNLFPNLKEKPLARTGADAADVANRRSREIVARRHATIPIAAGNWPARFAAALSAAADGATIGQLTRLDRGNGAKPETGVKAIVPHRAAEGFEQLRRASDAYAARTGARPKVFLAKMGPALQHKARADFSAGFFATAGFEAIAKQSFETPEAAAAAVVSSGAPIAVLCSTDDTYPTLVPVFAKAVKDAKPAVAVVLAGLPAEPAAVDAFKQAGVDEFIHIRANVQATLAKFLKQIGAL